MVRHKFITSRIVQQLGLSLVCLLSLLPDHSWAKHEAVTYSYDKLEQAVYEGDVKAQVKMVEAFYADRKYSPHDTLVWSYEHHTTLYNYYDPSFINPVIFISKCPGKKEVWEYWNMWSMYITDGKFEPKRYFKNAKQARRIANYNVLMLLSHEYGHHLADRYSVRSEVLNSHEYIADLASLALVESFPEESKLNSFQHSYIKLLRHLNQMVPEKARFEEIAHNLYQDQSRPNVVFPGDTALMPQYASAYFVRRIFFHENKHGVKAEAVFDSLLRSQFKPWNFKRFNNVVSIKSRRYTSAFDYPTKVDSDRSIMKFRSWGEPKADELFDFGFDDAGNAVYISALWPMNQVKGGIISIEMRSVSGLLLYRWYCHWDSTQLLKKISWHGFCLDESNNVSLLVSEVTASGSRRFKLYQSEDESFFLKSVYLPSDLMEKNPKLMRRVDHKLLLLNSELDGYSERFYAMEVHLRVDTFNKEYLFDLPGNGKWSGSWLADFESPGKGVLVKDQFMLRWQDDEITIIAGTGLEGNKRGGATEFFIPTAISLKGDRIGLVDLLPAAGQNRTRNILFERELRLQ